MRADRSDPHFEPDMPPVSAEHLIAYLFEVGPVIATGMGAGPITHQELLAWQANTGIRLQPWQARFLRMLSCDYVAEAERSKSRDHPPPWVGEPDREFVSRSIASTLSSRSKERRR